MEYAPGMTKGLEEKNKKNVTVATGEMMNEVQTQGDTQSVPLLLLAAECTHHSDRFGSGFQLFLKWPLPG